MLKQYLKRLFLNTKHEHFVFVIPVSETLDMKKAAALVEGREIPGSPRSFEKCNGVHSWWVFACWYENIVSNSR